MTLQEIIDTAKYGELANTAIKDNTDAIIAFVNLGMLELYKRFPIKVNEHIVTLVEGTTTYTLPTDYMYPLSAYGEVAIVQPSTVAPIPINDENDPSSIFFPNHRQVQIPLVATGTYVSIIYVSKPERYTDDDLAAEVDLPEALIDCLLNYMGYKAHVGIRGDGQSENNAHYLRFERSCDKARELGVAYPLDSWKMVDRLSNRGFV